MYVQQLSIFVENKKGRLANIAKILANADIDIRALCVADTNDFGVLRLIVDKPELAVKTLKQSNFTVSLTDVIAIGINDIPGSFAKIMELLSDHSVSVEYMYAFIGRDKGKAFIILRVDDNDKALSILTENKVILLNSDNIQNM